MKKIIVFSFLLFTFNTIFSQEISTEIQGKKIGYFVTLENKLHSELFNTGETYMSLDDSAQPIIYKRKEKEIPDLLVQYSFSKKDSIINEVLYEWDVYNFEKNDNNVKSVKFNKALIEKYNYLLKMLTNKYGKSKTKGNLDNIEDIETDEGLNRSDDWKPNDSLEIQMYTVISNYYKKVGFVTTNPTHRIRLYLKNIKKKAEPKLDEQAISNSNKNFENFISQLKDQKFASAKLFLSTIVSQIVTDNQLMELAKMIDFNNKLVQYYKGFQLTLTGENYLMLQYKYENEQSEVPNSIIKVIFDENNKILGVQPMKKE
jgi:hypothetical protein